MGKASSKRTYLLGVFRADYKIIEPLSIVAQYSLQHNYEIWNSFNNKYDFTDKLHPERRTFNNINRMSDYRVFQQFGVFQRFFFDRGDSVGLFRITVKGKRLLFFFHGHE